MVVKLINSKRIVGKLNFSDQYDKISEDNYVPQPQNESASILTKI